MDVREKLIKLIENGVSCPGGRDPFGDYCDTCQYSKSVDCSSERLVDYLISHGVTVQEWISVEERLPELGERVICTDGGAVFEQYRVEPSYVYGIWDRSGLKSPMQKVTHWMPLPEPPKGE